METLARTRAVGGSIVVTIPKEVAEMENIHENELVRLEITKARKSYFGAASGVGRFTVEDEWSGDD